MTYGLFCFLERVLHVLALNRLSISSFGDFLIMVLNGYKGLYELDEANIVFGPQPVFLLQSTNLLLGLSLMSSLAILEPLFGFLRTLSSLFCQHDMGPGLAGKYSHHL